MCSVGARELVCSLPLPLSCAVVLPATRAVCIPGGIALLEFKWNSRAGRRLQQRSVVLRAGRGGAEEEGEVKQPSFSFTRLGAQALICVLTLGFLDAGYSGDWSRIGVLSKELESAFRVGAYGVVPFSVILLWLISTSNQRGEL
ncbi:hypothetical protein GOP47_0025489 [Adiantum capillus-veneris]|uniref:DUF7887 domain-containing protein n=1 Tax=Adiantum capillus-veneris TaxID=13818 RepID=A0A9D4Z302_ADICA|nr:hypothetical protein GOP47_0025489 [Adiantum capillus-veneris]